MKWTNKRIKKYVLSGFLGLIVSFVIGAVCVVLSPFSLLYVVCYLIGLIYLLIVHLKEKPEEAKQLLSAIIDYANDPEVLRKRNAKKRKKAAAKRRRKQIRRTKRQTRRLVLLGAANKTLRELMK